MTFWTLALAVGSAVAAAVFSWLLTGFAGRMESAAAQQAGYVRWEQQRKPLVGGMAMFLAWLMGCVALQELEGGLRLWPWLGVASIGFAVGLADDAWGIKPRQKLAGQLACGLLLIVSGDSITFFGNAWLDGPLTLFWVVGLMNSLNMLDNMDGIVALVSAGVLAGCVAAGTGGVLAQGSGAVLTGALLGYFILNRHPSRLYMGDSGSQFLGALLALWGISFVWNAPHADSPWIVTPLRVALIFFIPLADTSLVTVARLARGQSPAVGGRDHLTHHLRYLGLPVAWIAPLLGIVALVLTLAAWHLLPVNLSPTAESLLAAALTVAACVVVTVVAYRQGAKRAA